MQDFSLELLIWLACILCNIFLGIMIIIQRKFQAKLKFKPFVILFFGILILITLFSNLLLVFTQETWVLVYEIVEIVFLQIFLLIFAKCIWHKDANLTLFAFSTILFGSFRAFGMYILAQMIFPELFSQIAIYTAFFYQFFFIIFVSLISIFTLFIFDKIFSRAPVYRSIFSFIWACLFIFGITPYLDVICGNLGVIPFFNTEIYPWIGFNLVNIESYGTIFLYAFMAFAIICKGFFLRYKNGFKFMSQTNPPFSNLVMKYIGIGSIILILAAFWYFFIILIDYSLIILTNIALLLEFFYYDLLLIDPFWLLMIIYGILLLISCYLGYLFFLFIKKRENLWNRPNSFNTLPIVNLSVLVFSGFMFCYYELRYLPPGNYLNDYFIKFVIYFYLIAFLLLLFLYTLTFQKKPWINFSHSISMYLLFIPLFGGYFITGQILNTTELLVGFISCASLQVYAVFLRSIKDNSFGFKDLNWFIILFWGSLSICFAGLLSISSLICALLVLILFYFINFQLKRRDMITIFYGLIGATVLLMGGTTSTFFTTVSSIGIPSAAAFGAAGLITIATVFYQFLQK